MPSSAKETCMFVLTHNRQEFLDGLNRWNWFVAMPFEIGALPENLPDILRLNVGNPGVAWPSDCSLVKSCL
jgi:hypothetical protein